MVPGGEDARSLFASSDRLASVVTIGGTRGDGEGPAVDVAFVEAMDVITASRCEHFGKVEREQAKNPRLNSRGDPSSSHTSHTSGETQARGASRA